MQNTFTYLIFLLTFVCTFSCARKEVYLLSNSGNPENIYVKKPSQTLPIENNYSLDRALLEASVPQPEPIVYNASTQSNVLPKSVDLPKEIQLQDYLTVQPNVKAVTRLVKQQVKIIKAEKATLKKQNRQADTGKPRNKLATVGFYLGLGALLALIVAGASGVGILSLLALFAAIGGFVTSKMGLSEINRNPDMYTGKGQALTGLIVSIAVLALFLIGIILLITVINNFQ